MRMNSGKGGTATRLRYRSDLSEGERDRGKMSRSVFYCSVILVKVQKGCPRVPKCLPETGLP